MHLHSGEFEGLVVRAKSGDRRAFDALFRAAAARLRSHIAGRMSRRVREVLDPSDVEQEVFLKAFRSFGVFRGKDEAELIRWLRWMADHVIVDEVRKYRSEKRGGILRPNRGSDRGGSDALHRVGDPRPGPTKSLSLREEAAQAERAFQRLPEKYRQIVLLRLLKGLSTRETASRLQMRENTVDVYFLRAMRKWKELAK